MTSDPRTGTDAREAAEQIVAMCRAFDPTSGTGRARTFASDVHDLADAVLAALAAVPAPTDEGRAALRALSEAATQGPWRQEPNTMAGQVWVSMGYGSDLEPATRPPDDIHARMCDVHRRRLFRVRSRRDESSLNRDEVFAQRAADAAFIVAAVNYVRAALAAAVPASAPTGETREGR